MIRRLAVTTILLTLACGATDDGAAGAAQSPGDTLTKRERDSILAQSRIPGAAGVGKAMRVADSVSARIQAADTVAP